MTFVDSVGLAVTSDYDELTIDAPLALNIKDRQYVAETLCCLLRNSTAQFQL